VSTPLVDLTLVGCEPVVSSTGLEFGVLGENVYSDGWSGAHATGWTPVRRHRVTWRVMNEAAATMLRHQLDAAQDNFGNVFIEVVGQDPIIGRIQSAPTITRHNAILWSAELDIEENR
jgi:hypothetical protein